MSKIGKQPVEILPEVEVKVNGDRVMVKGPKGVLKLKISRGISLKINGKQILVESRDNSKTGKAIYGTTRALLANMVKGVVEGWLKQLELVGTGYRSETDGKSLTLTVGFSHPVKIEAVEGIKFKVEKNIITVEGIDRQLVGQVAASIRSVRPPEPYKGKGIRYVDEVVRRKPGKAAKAAGAMS